MKKFRGPALWSIVGRPVAAIDGFKYSPVMKAHSFLATTPMASPISMRPKALGRRSSYLYIDGDGANRDEGAIILDGTHTDSTNFVL